MGIAGNCIPFKHHTWCLKSKASTEMSEMYIFHPTMGTSSVKENLMYCLWTLRSTLHIRNLSCCLQILHMSQANGWYQYSHTSRMLTTSVLRYIYILPDEWVRQQTCLLKTQIDPRRDPVGGSFYVLYSSGFNRSAHVLIKLQSYQLVRNTQDIVVSRSTVILFYYNKEIK